MAVPTCAGLGIRAAGLWDDFWCALLRRWLEIPCEGFEGREVRIRAVRPSEEEIQRYVYRPPVRCEIALLLRGQVVRSELTDLGSPRGYDLSSIVFRVRRMVERAAEGEQEPPPHGDTDDPGQGDRDVHYDVQQGEDGASVVERHAY